MTRRQREAALREQEAALRRRRLIRLTAVGVALALLVAAPFLLDDDGDGEPAAKNAAEQPRPPEGCSPEPPPRSDAKQYDQAPKLTVEAGVDYGAVIETNCGPIEMDLLEDEAPKTVANFVFLAEQRFYDGLLWHRIERNFVIQTGDPNGQNGTPPDGPGYSIPDELDHVQPKDYVFGVVGMANAGPNTGGSQFFVIVHTGPGNRNEPAGLLADYTIFGEVAESSYEVLNRIQKTEIKGGNDPAEAVQPAVPLYIESIEITRS